MIVGTAGHIDHGKSALVRALTGVDTDRLKDEKTRGISIDLGFAYMPTGDDSILGFVDVPGHERFVRNMLAGATGIDLVLLVVAADDGIMPQTREHLAIVDLLGITHGLVALTKVDLVPPERRAAVAQDIRHVLHPTGLAAAEIVPVSSVTGEGVASVRDKLFAAAGAFKRRRVQGRFRLAVDRCFTIAGAGTIVTGSVLSGTVGVGDNVVVSPAGLRARVRSIHAQNTPAQQGTVGDRCALNLVGDGINRQSIGRGDVVLDPALHAPAGRIDAGLTLLASETKPLAHWTPVHLHHAATEVSARAALLHEAPIAPGAAGRVQLVLERPVAAAVGDRFILRDTSGSRTIGGGHFIDLRAPQRRRRTPARLAQLDALGEEDATTALAALLGRWPFYVDARAFARDRALSEDQMQAALGDVAHRRVAVAGAQFVVAPQVWDRLAKGARTAVDAHHRVHPESPGLAAPQLAAMLEPRLPAKLATAIVRALVEAGVLGAEGGSVRAPGHRSGLEERDQRLWERIAPLLSGEERFRPPRTGELAARLQIPEADMRRALKALARRGDVIEVAPDHFFAGEVVGEMAAIVVDIARAQKDSQVSAAQFRDRLNNGRKAAIQILEYFDRKGLTARRGDLRRINPSRIDSFKRASEPARD